MRRVPSIPVVLARLVHSSYEIPGLAVDFDLGRNPNWFDTGADLARVEAVPCSRSSPRIC